MPRTIKQQWGKMGLSVDILSLSVSPLNEGLSKAVRKVFVELYKKVGFTVVNLSSIGIQKLVQPFLISRLFTRMLKVLSTT